MELYVEDSGSSSSDEADHHQHQAIADDVPVLQHAALPIPAVEPGTTEAVDAPTLQDDPVAAADDDDAMLVTTNDDNAPTAAAVEEPAVPAVAEAAADTTLPDEAEVPRAAPAVQEERPRPTLRSAVPGRTAGGSSWPTAKVPTSELHFDEDDEGWMGAFEVTVSGSGKQAGQQQSGGRSVGFRDVAPTVVSQQFTIDDDDDDDDDDDVDARPNHHEAPSSHYEGDDSGDAASHVHGAPLVAHPGARLIRVQNNNVEIHMDDMEDDDDDDVDQPTDAAALTAVAVAHGGLRDAEQLQRLTRQRHRIAVETREAVPPLRVLRFGTLLGQKQQYQRDALHEIRRALCDPNCRVAVTLSSTVALVAIRAPEQPVAVAAVRVGRFKRPLYGAYTVRKVEGGEEGSDGEGHRAGRRGEGADADGEGGPTSNHVDDDGGSSRRSAVRTFGDRDRTDLQRLRDLMREPEPGTTRTGRSGRSPSVPRSALRVGREAGSAADMGRRGQSVVTFRRADLSPVRQRDGSMPAAPRTASQRRADEATRSAIAAAVNEARRSVSVGASGRNNNNNNNISDPFASLFAQHSTMLQQQQSAYQQQQQRAAEAANRAKAALVAAAATAATASTMTFTVSENPVAKPAAPQLTSQQKSWRDLVAPPPATPQTAREEPAAPAVAAVPQPRSFAAAVGVAAAANAKSAATAPATSWSEVARTKTQMAADIAAALGAGKLLSKALDNPSTSASPPASTASNSNSTQFASIVKSKTSVSGFEVTAVPPAALISPWSKKPTIDIAAAVAAARALEVQHQQMSMVVTANAAGDQPSPPKPVQPSKGWGSVQRAAVVNIEDLLHAEPAAATATPSPAKPPVAAKPVAAAEPPPPAAKPAPGWLSLPKGPRGFSLGPAPRDPIATTAAAASTTSAATGATAASTSAPGNPQAKTSGTTKASPWAPLPIVPKPLNLEEAAAAAAAAATAPAPKTTAAPSRLTVLRPQITPKTVSGAGTNSALDKAIEDAQQRTQKAAAAVKASPFVPKAAGGESGNVFGMPVQGGTGISSSGAPPVKATPSTVNGRTIPAQPLHPSQPPEYGAATAQHVADPTLNALAIEFQGMYGYAPTVDSRTGSLYDPVSGLWINHHTMTQARAQHRTATRLTQAFYAQPDPSVPASRSAAAAAAGGRMTATARASLHPASYTQRGAGGPAFTPAGGLPPATIAAVLGGKTSLLGFVLPEGITLHDAVPFAHASDPRSTTESLRIPANEHAGRGFDPGCGPGYPFSNRRLSEYAVSEYLALANPTELPTPPFAPITLDARVVRSSNRLSTTYRRVAAYRMTLSTLQTHFIETAQERGDEAPAANHPLVDEFIRLFPEMPAPSFATSALSAAARASAGQAAAAGGRDKTELRIGLRVADITRIKRKPQWAQIEAFASATGKPIPQVLTPPVIGKTAAEMANPREWENAVLKWRQAVEAINDQTIDNVFTNNVTLVPEPSQRRIVTRNSVTVTHGAALNPTAAPPVKPAEYTPPLVKPEQAAKAEQLALKAAENARQAELFAKHAATAKAEALLRATAKVTAASQKAEITAQRAAEAAKELSAIRAESAAADGDTSVVARIELAVARAELAAATAEAAQKAEAVAKAELAAKLESVSAKAEAASQRAEAAQQRAAALAKDAQTAEVLARMNTATKGLVAATAAGPSSNGAATKSGIAAPPQAAPRPAPAAQGSSPPASATPAGRSPSSSKDPSTAPAATAPVVEEPPSSADAPVASAAEVPSPAHTAPAATEEPIMATAEHDGHDDEAPKKAPSSPPPAAAE